MFIRSYGCLTPTGLGLPDADRPFPRQPTPSGLGGLPLALPAAGWVEPIPRPGRSIGRPVRWSRLDRLSRLGLAAADAAVDAAGPPPSSAGVVLGTAHGSHLANEAFQLQLDRSPPAEASPALFTHTLPSAATGVISIHLGLLGPSATLADGVGAGLAAVDLARGIVAGGEASWMLAGAADTLSPMRLASAGERAGELAEGAAFLCISPLAQGARARLAGAGQCTGEVHRAEDEALEQAGLRRAALRGHLAYGPGGMMQLASVAPLVGACSLIARGALPALVSVRDEAGAALAVCLDVVAGQR